MNKEIITSGGFKIEGHKFIDFGIKPAIVLKKNLMAHSSTIKNF